MAETKVRVSTAVLPVVLRENGARLGWLIDPEDKQVHVHRPNNVEVLTGASEVSGDPELPGFTLDGRRIWEAGL